jgi:hypothetical protein
MCVVNGWKGLGIISSGGLWFLVVQMCCHRGNKEWFSVSCVGHSVVVFCSGTMSINQPTVRTYCLPVMINSQTHHSNIYIYIYTRILLTMSFTLRLCQYTTSFGSAKPSLATCINV